MTIQIPARRARTISRKLVALCLLATLASCSKSDETSKPPQASSTTQTSTVPSTLPAITGPRKAFAEQFFHIKFGMAGSQVLALLGKPDDVRTMADVDGWKLSGIREIWRYGTNHHLGFATLGSIAIDKHGNVQYLSGTTGADELVRQLGETELRRLLCLLAATGENVTAENFHPRPTIAAINALQPLGKTLGVAVMREYLAVNPRWYQDDNALFLVMRGLFQVPPPLHWWQSQPAGDPARVVYPGFFRQPALWDQELAISDPTLFPRFPLAIVDDVPLMLSRLGTLSGQAESPVQHLNGLDRDASWRQQPLTPTNDPTAVLAHLEALLPPRRDQPSDHRAMMARQILRLIDTVYPLPPNGDDPDKAQSAFDAIALKVKAMNIRWDPRQCCYVRSDGSTLPPQPSRPIAGPRF